MADKNFNHAQEIGKMIEVMPPEMKQAFQKVVLAGKKMLYSPDTREMINEVLTSEAEMGEKLGAGIANLMIMMDNQAQGAIPKDVMIPAATVLLFDAADALKQSGETISAEELGQAYEIMFYNIFAGYGAQPEQVDQVMDKMGAQYGGEKPQGGMLAQAGA